MIFECIIIDALKVENLFKLITDNMKRWNYVNIKYKIYFATTKIILLAVSQNPNVF